MITLSYQFLFFDLEILDKLPKDDARVTFIYNTLQNIRQTLQKNYNSSLAIYHGKPEVIYKEANRQLQYKCRLCKP